jgi:hypothetical protein
MKKTEKKNYETIKEKIRKETGYFIKNLNSKNAKKELEGFIYMLASDYCRGWLAISYMEEIQTEHIVCIKTENKMESMYKLLDIVIKTFQNDAEENSEALDGLCKLMIENNQIYRILKEDIPNLEKIREFFKVNNIKNPDLRPIYEELAEFYLNYEYGGNIENFIKMLNIRLNEILNNKEILERCLPVHKGSD